MPSTYTLIASNILASATNSITFSSIPATYTDLVLRWSTRSAASGRDDQITFNGDSSTIYSSTSLWGTGSSVVNNQDSAVARINVWYGNTLSTYTASTFSSGELYVPNYTSTVNKPTSFITVAENNSATVNGIVTSAALYRNTSALTSLTFFSPNNFVIDSSFYLYGIKNS